jgi:VCBS repeat protein
MSSSFAPRLGTALTSASAMLVFAFAATGADAEWKKQTVYEGAQCLTAVAGDFTKDGQPDIIANAGEKTLLFVGPNWREVVLDATPGHDFIHSEAFDVDGDGDLDYIAARYQPGLIVWLEQPAHPLTEPWTLRIASRQLNGIHGLLQGDVDRDGRIDLIANSAQPMDTPFPESILWLSVPTQPRSGAPWKANPFAHKDAPGLTHYMGFGDVNGDGRPDIASGAKGSPSPVGNYFAWWEAPANPAQPWKKHVIAEKQMGATNIHPGDVNQDGQIDFIAARGHDRGVVWFEAPAWREHPIHPSLKEPHCLAVRDMDGDGDLDAASCGYGDKEVWWFENAGRGTFTNHLVAQSQEAYDIRASDLDRDGDIDLLIAGRGSKNVTWYANPSK